jgi:hypothetical protein
MPLVSKPISFTCRAERSAGARASPNRAAIGPSGTSQCKGPDTDSGEEMALRESGKVAWSDIFDTPLVYFARRNVAGGNQISKPLCGVGVELVVISFRHSFPIDDWQSMRQR